MTLKELVKKKGYEIIAVDGAMPVAEAAKKMVEKNIGSLLIVGDDGDAKGVFTERDVLKCLARKGTTQGVPLSEIMTRNLIVAKLDDDISYAMSIMIQHGIRHLPVVDEKGKVITVLSMRDVVKAQVNNLEAEVHYLKEFMTEEV